jgi:hypothetical protein
VIGKNTLGHIRGQDGVADVGVPDTDFLNRQVVRQMAGADDLNIACRIMRSNSVWILA